LLPNFFVNVPYKLEEYPSLTQSNPTNVPFSLETNELVPKTPGRQTLILVSHDALLKDICFETMTTHLHYQRISSISSRFSEGQTIQFVAEAEESPRTECPIIVQQFKSYRVVFH